MVENYIGRTTKGERFFVPFATYLLGASELTIEYPIQTGNLKYPGNQARIKVLPTISGKRCQNFNAREGALVHTITVYRLGTK